MQKDAPQIARILNPFNTSAQVTYLQAELSKDPEPEALIHLEATAARTIAFAPARAEAHSWAAEVAYRAHREQEAQKLIDRALSLRPIDLQANLARLREASERQDVVEVLHRLDVIGQYWPASFPSVAPNADLALATKADSQALEELIGRDPPWREALIQHLMITEAGRTFLEHLFVREAELGKSVDTEHLNDIMERLLKSGAAAKAYRLFVRTLSEQGRRQLGTIHNAKFHPRIGNSPFNWSKPNCPASETTLSGASEGLIVRFLGTPARHCGIRQVLVLSPLSATWTVRISADNLNVPSGLHWKLSCGNGALLAEIDVPPGTYEPRQLSRSFQTPERQCPFQIIELSTGENTSSWRNRYSGTVRFHELSISSE